MLEEISRPAVAQPGGVLFNRTHDALAPYVLQLAARKQVPQNDEHIRNIAGWYLDGLAVEEMAELSEAPVVQPPSHLLTLIDGSLDNFAAFCAVRYFTTTGNCRFTDEAAVDVCNGVLADLTAGRSDGALFVWPDPELMMSYIRAVLMDAPPGSHTPETARADIVGIVRYLTAPCPREAPPALRAHDAAAFYVKTLAEYKCEMAPPWDIIHGIAARAIEPLSASQRRALRNARDFAPGPELHWRMNSSLDRMMAFCAASRYAEKARCDFTEDDLLAIRDGVIADLKGDAVGGRMLQWPHPEVTFKVIRVMLADVPPGSSTPEVARADIVMLMRKLAEFFPREAQP